MTIELQQERVEHPSVVMLTTLFTRAVALVMVLLALGYWNQLTGIAGNPQWRFDNMPEHWQVASTVLAVVLPVAAVGLWSGYAWGVYVWVIAVIIEWVIYGWLPGLFGEKPLLLLFHLACIISYAAIRIIARRIERAARRRQKASAAAGPAGHN